MRNDLLGKLFGHCLDGLAGVHCLQLPMPYLDHLGGAMGEVHLPMLKFRSRGSQGRAAVPLLRGYVIRFRDGRTPLGIPYVDPAMTNCLALVEAVILQMSEHGALEKELVKVGGKRMVKRVYWRSALEPETPAT